jgi:hypothetical protein
MRSVGIIISMSRVGMRSVAIYVIMWGMRIRVDMRNVVVTGRIVDIKVALFRPRTKLWRRICMTSAI